MQIRGKSYSWLLFAAALAVVAARNVDAQPPAPPRIKAPGKGAEPRFEPTRESLSKYKVPEWCQDAKIGFFYHWGPSSVSGDLWDKESMEFCRRHKHRTPPGQYGSHMYATRGPEKEKDPLRILHEKWYGPAEKFGYKDLIPLMTGAKWNPENIVRLLDNAGVKYIVPMAIHHDGFAMWDSKVIDKFNAAKMGPKQNTTAQIIEAARKRGIKVGVSTHCARHSWYYTKQPEFDSGDPRYEQLYGEGLGKDGLPQPRAIQKWEDTLAELVDTFQPDYIFVDGGTADIHSNKKSYVVTDAFRRIVANYYNSARQWGGEPVISFKRESLYKEEAIPDYEGGDLLEAAPYKWQTHSSIAGWFYRVSEKPTPSFRLFRKICDVVSKNGNLLLNLGLKADGSMREDEKAFLLELAQWMDVVGVGIHATRPWMTYGELAPGKELFFKASESRGIYDDPERVRMGFLRPYDGDIRYTRSKDGKTVYAFRYSYSAKPFVLMSFGAGKAGEGAKVKSVRLAGSDEKVQWKRAKNGIEIQPPAKPVFSDPNWPVMYILEAGGDGTHSSRPKQSSAPQGIEPAPANCPACAMGLTADFVFKRLDVDRDQKIVVKEFEQSPGMQGADQAREAVGKIDTDGDGALAWEEFEAAYRTRHANCKPTSPTVKAGAGPGVGPDGRGDGNRFAQVFMLQSDKNGDGRIDRQEFRGSAAGFERMDKNGNGFIEPDELNELHQRRLADPQTMRQRLQSGDVRRPPQSKRPKEPEHTSTISADQRNTSTTTPAER